MIRLVRVLNWKIGCQKHVLIRNTSHHINHDIKPSFHTKDFLSKGNYKETDLLELDTLNRPVPMNTTYYKDGLGQRELTSEEI